MTVQNLGAALSPAIGGWLAQSMGYSGSFLVLGSFATVSIILWSLYHKPLRKACDN